MTTYEPFLERTEDKSLTSAWPNELKLQEIESSGEKNWNAEENYDEDEDDEDDDDENNNTKKAEDKVK